MNLMLANYGGDKFEPRKEMTSIVRSQRQKRDSQMNQSDNNENKDECRLDSDISPANSNFVYETCERINRFRGGNCRSLPTLYSLK